MSEDHSNIKPIIRIKKMITEDMTVRQVVDNGAPSGWEQVFEGTKDTLYHISDILKKEEEQNGHWVPRKIDLFRALEIIHPRDVRVCIIGMDPYHSVGANGPHAMGLAFSVKRGEKIPPSLRTIFFELADSVKGFKIPTHGDLSSWSHQGVLLLNACLTVQIGKSGSHKNMWGALTQEILRYLSSISPNCVYLLWGKRAQELQQYISGNATIFTAPHPSPLNNGRDVTFKGCNHFNKVNDILISRGQEPIDWNL